ncbi:patatin-like phospholipase family protein [Fluviicola taffensis]|uniref:Patatin n=1 Tax=Fluviicola taffensis (strain DSM 16823 / NCIMB 13979 / RW262) TaxID=755732 RepID=F2IG79_FLUTR|nr:patatin-like phospholipase family protein [Fluviicola taffensis]AEA44714.1 Patatin [Fluviicola taffensis DSM 16823]
MQLAKKLTISLFLIALAYQSRAQGVGVVLSGGGAAGFAHIGVLKALEENNIPINYITGTSSGALVGAMYACGYSPLEIENYVLSNKFQLMSKGEIEQRYEFLLREDNENASGINFSFSLDSIFSKSLPTNFIRPELLDFEMLRLFALAGASKSYNFDSLFVPFRCVASDIVAKQGVVFSTGQLNEAVRASMTFPFYVNPIRINGVLYFDGGLYNNFPSDVMYNNFPVDFIIGSNVSYNAGPPREDDLISQLTNMLVTHTSFKIPCESGIIIEPKSDISTFDFDDVDEAIRAGYESTISMMDSIKKMVDYRISLDDLNQKRNLFKSNIKPFVISEVNTSNKYGLDESYVRKSILKNNKGQLITGGRFKRRYFRTYATPQIKYLYPTLQAKSDSTFALNLKVTESKPFRIDFGGIVSTRAINTGFIQLNYMRLDKIASTIQVGGYFGKFYNSGRANIDLHFPSYYPISANIYGVINRWDYFKSFTTFFDDEKPSFLVQNEAYIGGGIKLPIFNNSKFSLDYRHFETQDRYYQSSEFTNKDTTDRTILFGDCLILTLEHNSLNRKQWASSGTLAQFKAIYSGAVEHSTAGSTSLEDYDYRNGHHWFNIRGEIQSFPLSTKYFSFGLHGLASITNLSLLKNYTATLLNMNAFQPLPDLQTYFFTEYRSPQYIGGGVNIIFSLRKNIDIRLDGYWYQPFISIKKNDDGTFGYSKPFKGESQVASLTAIYHSPLGPIRASLNYFPKQKSPLAFQFTYGFIIFHERAFR